MWEWLTDTYDPIKQKAHEPRWLVFLFTAGIIFAAAKALLYDP